MLKHELSTREVRSDSLPATRAWDRPGRSLSYASLAATIALAFASGCATGVDSASARAEFSSKERSLPRQVSSDVSRPTASSRRTASAAEHIEPGSFTTFTTTSAPSTPTGASSSARGTYDPNDPLLGDLAGGSTAGAATIASLDTLEVLRRAGQSNWAALRAHAIEASARNESLLRELAPRGLVDENRGVRFVACMAIGEARKTPQPAWRKTNEVSEVDLCVLVRPLLNDESASVRAAAMLALSRCGVEVDLTPIAAMLHDVDPEVRANAYLVLGELGNRSAVPLIRESLGRGMKLVNPIRARLVDLTAAEALVKLGDEREIEPIRAALFAPPEQSELTSVACDAIGRLRDEVSRPMLERLLGAAGGAKRLPEVRLSAARAFVRIGGSSDTALLVAREYLGSTDARVRAQTAALLGEVRSPEAAAMLSALLRDANPTVQVAAAAGLQVDE